VESNIAPVWRSRLPEYLSSECGLCGTGAQSLNKLANKCCRVIQHLVTEINDLFCRHLSFIPALTPRQSDVTIEIPAGYRELARLSFGHITIALDQMYRKLCWFEVE
jgi:hypothetical protein